MYKSNLFIGAVAVLALVLGGYALVSKPATSNVVSSNPPFGAVSGPDVSFQTFFHDNVNIGGFDFATSSIGAVTYTATSIAKSRVIEHIAASSLTATLPTNAALSAVGFLPNVGDTQTVFIHASTTKITLVGNTGVNLFSGSSTLVVAAGSLGRLEFVRLGATEGRLIQVFLSAD